MIRQFAMDLAAFYRAGWIRLQVWALKRRARKLYYANCSEMDSTDCGWAMRDMLSKGRLSRREAEIHRLVAEAKRLEAEL